MGNTGYLHATMSSGSLYTFKMNTSVSFSTVFYPYYSAYFTFSLYNLSKTSALDIFVVNTTCFLKGTKILCENNKYVCVEHLKKGDLIKTYKSGYKPLELLGKSRIYHSPENVNRTKDRLYVYKKSDIIPELTDDLCITGMHSALVPRLNKSQIELVYDTLEDIYLTEGLYRLPSCIDERSKIYDEEGYFDVYHLALENEDYCGNYGIYANGMLMETTSRRWLKEMSHMELCG
jgi:hypothetical protein